MLKFLPIAKSDLKHVALVFTASAGRTKLVSTSDKQYTVHATTPALLDKYSFDWNVCLFVRFKDGTGEEHYYSVPKCNWRDAAEAAYIALDKWVDDLNPNLKSNAGFAVTRKTGDLDIPLLVDWDKDFWDTSRVYSTKENYERVLS